MAMQPGWMLENVQQWAAGRVRSVLRTQIPGARLGVRETASACELRWEDVRAGMSSFSKHHTRAQ